MLNGLLNEGPIMDETDLIKIVVRARRLDLNGAGDNGENLQLLWNALAASSDLRYSGAEETILRRLLKSMHGSSDAAAMLRQHPLTWTIMTCVFQRIPLFSLAKSFADRKFTLVLEETLKDLAKPVAVAEKSIPSKRKRSATQVVSADTLCDPRSCLETAGALFWSIKSLLERLDSTTGRSPRDEIGFGHMKTLFYKSATDAASLTAPALQICETLLSSDSDLHDTASAHWIKTIAKIWKFHSQGSDDAMSIAMNVFRPVSAILAKLGAFRSGHRVDICESLRKTWVSDIYDFMHQNFMLPARTAFVDTRDVQVFTSTLEVCESSVHLAAPALYAMASNAFKNNTLMVLRKDNADWVKNTFSIVAQAIKTRPDKKLLMESILEQALQNAAPVAVGDLRGILREYVLEDQQASWPLVAKIARCEPDVFQFSDEGTELRREICERMITERNPSDNHDAMVEVIKALQDGFRTRRDLPGFLRMWFKQMCEAEEHQCQKVSPWFTAIRCGSTDKTSLDSILETEFSPKQLNDVISHVKETRPDRYPEALAVFTSTLAQAISSEAFVDAVGKQLFDLVSGVQGSSTYSALSWRVVSATMAWVAPSERIGMWTLVKKRLGKIAEEAPVVSAQAYEAFKCCCKIWDISWPDQDLGDEPAATAETLLNRLLAEIAAAGGIESIEWCPELELESNTEFLEKNGYQQYLLWMLNASSRCERLFFNKFGKLPPAVLNALEYSGSSASAAAPLWNGFLGNDVNLNDGRLVKCLANILIAALGEASKKSHWSDENARLWIQELSRIPLDALDRDQRELIMTTLVKRQSLIAKLPEDANLNELKLILSLYARIMRRPTFYSAMSFHDLVECSRVLSTCTLRTCGSSELFLELLDRFSQTAAVILKQMAEHVDDRSIRYFREVASFVTSCIGKLGSKSADADQMPPFHMTLLKTLTLELTQSANARSHEDLNAILQEAQQVLQSFTVEFVASSISDKGIWDARDPSADLGILATIDAAVFATNLSDHVGVRSSSIRKLEKRTGKAMPDGDIRAWKVQVFLRTHFPGELEESRPTNYPGLSVLPRTLREGLLADLVCSVTNTMGAPAKLSYLGSLVGAVKTGWHTDGQLLAIASVVNQLLTSPEDVSRSTDDFSLSMAHSDLMLLLLKRPSHAPIICRILQSLLEVRPQCMTQWNIEITLSTVGALAKLGDNTAPYTWLCKLVEVVIKKHRLRLEGHFPFVLSTMQALLNALITTQQEEQEAKAHCFARLVTLMCEPTAGTVSRSRRHGTLDSARDAAKRTAGRHMYLVLAHYVKLQLDFVVARAVSEALESAVNAIFDITPPEKRKMLNDVMNAGGRAILRETFNRYVKFGKWSGV